MPRGGARPRPKHFSRLISTSNRLRWARYHAAKDRAAVAAEKEALRHGASMREDEKPMLGHMGAAERGGAGAWRAGVRRDKDLTSEGIVTCAFMPSDSTGKLATGFERHSITRAKLVVASALEEEQNDRISTRLGCHSSVKVIKRPLDEAPMKIRDEDKCITSVKLLNQRCVFPMGRARC